MHCLKPFVAIMCSVLSIILFMCAGCQQGPQRIPAEEAPFSMADGKTTRSRSSDPDTPKLPKDLVEWDEVSRTAEAEEGASTEPRDHTAPSGTAEGSSPAPAPATDAGHTERPGTPVATRERDEPVPRKDQGSATPGPTEHEPAEVHAEPEPPAKQPADAGETASSPEEPKPSADAPPATPDRETGGEAPPPPDAPSHDMAQAGEKRPEAEAAPANEPPDAPDAGAPRPSEREPETPPRRESAVALAEIPGLPAPPPTDTRDRPKGIVQAPKGEPNKPAEVRGRWRQTGTNNRPDFLPGGYESSILLFRPEGILEVQRTFGKDGAILLTWEVGYKWNKKKSVLTLGEEAEFRPPPPSLKGFNAGEVVIKSAVRPFPVALPCVRGDDGTIRLGKKVYVPVKEAGGKSASDKGQPEKKAPSSGGSSGQD
ncbi:MAG: hypothetical protein R6X20_12595 [Phycisphaerae bacterium]